MTITELLQTGVQVLSGSGTDTPRLDCEVLLSHITKKERIYFILHPAEEAAPEVADAFLRLIERRKKNEPVSYLTGEREFMSLPFHVRDGVLIPRPDTETLVEFVLNKFSGTCPTVLDLCTGSGAIGVSIAKYLDSANVTAVDFSEICVQCAKENADRNGVGKRVRVLRQNILEQFDLGQRFDCIVSNPPYIRSDDIAGLEETVRLYEPLTALDGGRDGLIFYRRIAAIAPGLLNPGGILAFEVGHDQADEVAALLRTGGCFDEPAFSCDLAGIRRVVSGALIRNNMEG